MSCGLPQLFCQLPLLESIWNGNWRQQKKKFESNHINNLIEYMCSLNTRTKKRTVRLRTQNTQKTKKMDCSSFPKNLFYIYRLVWWNKLKIKRFLSKQFQFYRFVFLIFHLRIFLLCSVINFLGLLLSLAITYKTTILVKV